MKNDHTYEYRVFTNRLVDVGPMEVGNCTKKVVENLKSKDKVDGRFFHTSDSNEWFFCWDGKLQKLNLKGDADVNDALAQVEKLIADATVTIEDAKKTASEAKDAADAATSAVESIKDKADKSDVDVITQTVESLKQAVKDKANQTDVDDLAQVVENKANAEDVQTLSDKVNTIKLDDYALKTEIPTDVSKFNNDAGYLNKSDADKLYAPIGSASDGSDSYATEDFVKSEIEKIIVPTKVSDLENDSKFITIDEVPEVTVPTNTSDLTNDSGFITINDIPEEYVTESELNDKGYLTEHQDISGKQDVIGDLEDIRANAALGATALQEVPAEYVTDTELTAKGYLTAQSLDGYAKTEDIPLMENYYSKEEIDGKLDDINSLLGEALNITNIILA